MNHSNKGYQLTERDILYKQAFGTDAGRRVLEDMKSGLLYGQTLYYPKQTSEELHFQIGRQSVINEILFILEKEQKRE